VLDLGGNVRKNPKLSGTTHNVFGIQVGVSITLLVRRAGPSEARRCRLSYASAGEYWTRAQKYSWLDELGEASNVEWSTLDADGASGWTSDIGMNEFQSLIRLHADGENEAAFLLISNGVQTNRDAWVYNFSSAALSKSARQLIGFYNQQVRDWKAEEREVSELDSFLENDDKEIKWSSRLKERLLAGRTVEYAEANIRKALYRPFCMEHLYFDDTLVHRQGQFPRILPAQANEKENIIIWLKTGSDWPFFALCSNTIADQLPQGGSQCFPFYTYAEDGTHRRENITDWALEQFRSHYHDPSITKWDIFHYIYAVLHHPEYRTRYAANLRRELPRIPFASYVGLTTTLSSRAQRDRPEDGHAQSRDLPSAASATTANPNPQADAKQNYPVSPVPPALKDVEVFQALAKAGQRLAEIHVHYEQQPEYPLQKVEKAGEKLDYRVNKMKLSKDKSTLIYNQFLTLSGIPKETYGYKLGNRSALEWVIDQYQVSTDKRSGIVNDPNRDDDKEYILRLIGQVITVSLETVKIVNALPQLGIPESPGR
jgi:predicted helicase